MEQCFSGLLVAFGGKTSSPVKLICEVPQGSVLGQLLFVLCAADIMNISQSHGLRIHAYAYDLQTYISCKAVNQIAAICQIQSKTKLAGCRPTG